MITIVIPIAPYHLAVAQEAIASCAAQSIPVQTIPVIDHDGRGAGWARNQGLAQVQTDFVTFLDADDLLDPQFAHATLSAYAGRRYVYTDWYQDAQPVAAPDRAWINSTWHVITTLLPTSWARHVGGFDETLPGGEDTDFYLKLKTAGLCGQRLAQPLVHYRRGGRRAHEFLSSAEYSSFQTLMTNRYGVNKPMAACCGEYNPEELPPINEQESGFVLARALWGGNRNQRGSSGRVYPRAGNGALMWVYESDVERAPNLWAKVVDTPKPPSAQFTDFHLFANEFLGGGDMPAREPVIPSVKPGVVVAPDVQRLIDLYRAASDE